MNPIFKACELGDTKALARFQTAKLNSVNKLGYTPLFFAAAHQRTLVVSALLEKGVDVNKPSKTRAYGKTTAFYISSLYNNIEIMEMLLAAGANLEARGMDSKTPLAASCLNGNEATVSFLVKKGANVNAKDDKGNSPLFDATNARSLVCCTILLEAGANINLRNKDGCTPLYGACESAPEELVAYLLEKGALIEFYNKRDGTTPLMIAAINNRSEIVRMLLDRGAVIDWKCKLGGFATALFWASEYGSLECAQLLIQRGADSSLMDCYGRNSLHAACQKGADSLVGVLLKRKELFCADNNGNTPLHLAVEYSRLRVIECLLNAKVDAGLKNKKGKSAQELAEEIPGVISLFNKP